MISSGLQESNGDGGHLKPTGEASPVVAINNKHLLISRVSPDADNTCQICIPAAYGTEVTVMAEQAELEALWVDLHLFGGHHCQLSASSAEVPLGLQFLENPLHTGSHHISCGGLLRRDDNRAWRFR